jgi:serine/threonine protein kinase
VCSQVKREIEMLRGCVCPNVVQYLGSFAHTDHLWIIMEYCEGGSLSDIMEARMSGLTEPQIAAVIASTVDALFYLHKRHKIHRDIKAGNLLLTSDGLAKLADFGIAATLGHSLERRRTVIGTPFWMAPEVITCKRGGPGGGASLGYDERADLWSVGITALELAEGAPPHAAVSPLTAIFLIPTQPPPTLAEPSRWSAAFNDIVRRLLIKDPIERLTAAMATTDRFVVEVTPRSRFT